MGIVSFDFDGTLCCIDQDGNSLLRANPRSLTLFNKHKNKKDKIYIITYRNPENETVEYKSKNPSRILIQEFLDEHGLSVDGILFTNHTSKLPYITSVNASKHYDDCYKVLQELENTKIELIYITPIVVVT
jgi:hypothetical protein